MNPHPFFVSRSNCPVCDSTHTVELRKTEFTASPIWEFLQRYYSNRIPSETVAGAYFEVVQCKNCSFTWQQNILNDAGMEKLYDEWISSEDSLAKKQVTDISLYAGYARQVEAIAHLLGKKPNETMVLDFGMGWGYWCRIAQAYGFQAYGVEIATERLAYGRQFGLQAVSDLNDLPDIQFDFINSEQVFEHVPAPRESLVNLVSKLKRGGIIRISVPNGSGISEAIQRPGWKPASDAIHPLEHINCFTNQTLISLAASAGLKLAEQPRFLGQGLLGKSYGGSKKSWLTSVVGRYYRRYRGTTLYFYLPK